MAQIIKCDGEGQGSCDQCDDLGIWNRHWMSMLYHVASDNGHLYNRTYCYKHAKEFKDKLEYQQTYGVFE